MKFAIKTNENILGLGRAIGYRLLGNKDNEFSFVRAISGNNYPRFHLYTREGGNELVFNLHLDQKKPSYKSQTAHSGEYEGELVEREAGRIKAILRI